MHDWLRAKLTQVLNQVVHKGVVVVDHQNSGHQTATVERERSSYRTGSVYSAQMATPGKRKVDADQAATPSSSNSTPTSTSKRVTPPKAKKDASSTARYTAPVKKQHHGPSPKWVPITMFGAWGVGLLVIILNYMQVLPGTESGGNGWYLVAGLGSILAGIMVATQYR